MWLLKKGNEKCSSNQWFMKGCDEKCFGDKMVPNEEKSFSGPVFRTRRDGRFVLFSHMDRKGN
jgi:hypothetical protein